MSERPFTVGLTGGIGSGKNAVADLFAALGASVVDTDVVAHALTAPDGAAIAPIRQTFGDHMIAADGRLDRHAMRKLVFDDPAARQRLEAILHPMIRDESDRLCRTADAPYVILSVPLLLESGHYLERCDRLCVVDCPEATQIERVKARSNLDERQIRAIMAAQADRETRLRAADDVIDNGGPIEALAPQVEKLHRRYLGMASADK